MSIDTKDTENTDITQGTITIPCGLFLRMFELIDANEGVSFAEGDFACLREYQEIKSEAIVALADALMESGK